MKYWKEILIVVLVIVIFTFRHQYKREKFDKNLIIKANTENYNVAKYYKNKNGDLTAQVFALEATVNSVKDYANELGIDKKRLEKQVGNLNNLVTYWKGQVRVADTVVVTLEQTVEADSAVFAGDYKFDYTNDYLSVDGIINTEEGSLWLSYDYQFKWELTVYNKRQGFLKPKQLVGDMVFNDPNIRMSEFRGFVITQDKKKWYETKAFAFGVGFLGGAMLMR